MRRLVILLAAGALLLAAAPAQAAHHRHHRVLYGELVLRRHRIIRRATTRPAAAPAIAPVLTVEVVGQTPHLERIERAVEQQVDVDVHRAWDTPFIRFVDSGPAAMIVLLTSQRAVDGLCLSEAWGCHWQSGWELVAAVDVSPGGASPSDTLSHELVEAVVDPSGGAQLFGYLKEACDPVQGSSYYVDHNTVQLSDFVYPSWFQPAGRAPYDLLGDVHRARALLSGGFATPVDGPPVPGPS